MKNEPIGKPVLIFVFILQAILINSASAQGTQINFNTIPKSGTVMVYSHQDDDVIWMLPWWNKTEKFFQGSVPSTPDYRQLIHNQQVYLDNQGTNIVYEANWVNPWYDITNNEYFQYYWNSVPAYNYIALDHIESRLWSDTAEISRYDLNKMKAKLEQYISSPGVSRIITHNNWGEYGHKHHKAVNRAVRELAVKYRKDVWMLGTSGTFVDYPIPVGANITYTLATYDAALFAGIRNQYFTFPSGNNYWTWDNVFIPQGNIKYIKIVDAGIDKSSLLTGEKAALPGPFQDRPGAYLFNGLTDYMTLIGNINTSFTIAMWIRPDAIKAMDVSKMTEYPAAASCDRSFYMQTNGRITARIFDGQSRTVTSNTALTAGNWTHILMTGNGSTLKIYINGVLENNVPAGSAFTSYSSPEFVLGQKQETSSFFNGQIFDVRLFDHVLTDSEISALGSSGSVTYTINSSAGAGGTINPSGSIIVNQGSNRTFTIVPNSGFQIADVTIDNSSAGPQSAYTFNNVVANHTIAASFSSVPTTNLTISGVTANNKVYNKTITATLNTGGATLFGVSGSDIVNLVSSGATGTFANKNVGTGKTVTTSGFTITGADAGKYTLTQPSAVANITAANLNVSGVTANNKVYNGTTTATLNTGSTNFTGVFAGDVVSLVSAGATGTFSNKNAGIAIVVSTAGFTLGGTDAVNYTLTQPLLSANITSAFLTLTGVTTSNKIYDASTSATLAMGNLTLAGILGTDVVNLNSTGAIGTFVTKKVGINKTVQTSGFVLEGTDASNYNLSQPTTTANITPYGLTVSGVTANNKVYDGTTSATLNTGGAALAGVFGGDIVSVISTGATGTFVNKNAGTAKPVSTTGFSFGGTDAGNYTVTQPSTTANITAVPLTIAGVTTNNKVYDRTSAATLNTGSATLIGILGGDVVSLISTGATGTFASNNVATGKPVTTLGFSLSGTDATNYNLIQPASTGDISPAGLTVTGVIGNNKVYDRTTAATLNTGSATIAGVFGGDVVSLISTGATAIFANKNAGSARVITTSGFTPGGTDAVNYNLIQPVITANITQRGVTLSGVTTNNKVYDRTTAASLNTGSAIFVGVLGSDVVSVTLTAATGTFVNAKVGTAKQVSITGFVIGGADAGNYNLTQPSSTADITAAGLTVTGVTANSKVYDGTTIATLNSTGSTLVGAIDTDAVNLISTAATGTFINKNVGTAKQVSGSGFTLGGVDALNYTVIQPSLTANILTKNLFIGGSFIANNKIYDSTISAVIISNSLVLITKAVNDDVILTAVAVFADSNIGTGKLVRLTGSSLSGADASNYTLSLTGAPTTTTTITLSGVFVTGISASSKVYDGTAIAILNTVNASLVGIMGTDVVSIISTGATGTFATKNAGTGISVSTSGLTLGGTDAVNYTLTQPVSNANISAKVLTIIANNLVKPYRTLLTFTGTEFTTIGLVAGDAARGVTITSPGTSASVFVGTYVISVSGGVDNNYHNTYVNGTLTVSKSTIIATADYKTKVYGTENPVLSISYSGFINNEDPSVLDVLPVAATSALNTSVVGTYSIILSGGSDNNYNITRVNGSFEITKAPLAFTAEDKTKIYGQVNPGLSIIYSGFVPGQDQSVLEIPPVAETIANLNSDAGNYDIIVSGAVAANYSFTYNKGVMRINKADQIVTFGMIPADLRMTQEYKLNTTAESGLPVNFKTSDPNIATVTGNTLKINKDGKLTITALQNGNNNWNPSEAVTQSIVTLPTFDNITSLFSPNNDGMNDYWYIPDLEQYGKLQVTVYNRFGHTVYKSDSYKNDWDGTWNGYPLPSASYYYLIKSSEKGFIKGVVNIVR